MGTLKRHATYDAKAEGDPAFVYDATFDRPVPATFGGDGTTREFRFRSDNLMDATWHAASLARDFGSAVVTVSRVPGLGRYDRI